MKNIYAVVLLLVCCITTQAQNTLTGRIVDQSNTPIDYAEVLLLQDNETVIKQSFSNEEGKFILDNIPNGAFNFKISYLGKVLHDQILTVNKNVDLKDIAVNNDNQLTEIVLQADKKLVERKVDRLVFNTANSIASQGMDAIEALSNTPLVKVVDDKVSIVGKSNVTIMIDDRILYLSGDALTNYLKTLRSDDIEKIEVITAPPAKYEASGNSGLINIVMKKNRKMGLYGTISSAYTLTNKSTYSTNGSVNYQNKKWNVTLKANGASSNNYSKNNYTFTNKENGLNTTMDNTSKYKNVSTNLTTNYQITDNDLIGVSYNFTKANNDQKTNSTSNYVSYPQATIDSTLVASTYEKSKNYYHTLNMFYDKKLDTLGSKLSLGVNYFSNSPDDNTSTKDINITSLTKNDMYYTNQLKYNVWSANADLTYKLSWADIEGGVKYTNYDNKAQVNYFNLVQSDYVLDTTKSNRFNYTENNYAGYISLSKKLSEKWQVKGGLRYEQTEIKGHLVDTNEQFSKSYGKLFPTAYVSYNPNDNNAFSFNYSKRINRPDSSILNPFRYYVNTYAFSSGNPQLDPSITNNYELTYVLKSVFNVTLNYYNLKDAFDQVITFNGRVMESIYANAINSDNYGVNVSYSDKLQTWWETNTGFDYYYSTPYYSKETKQVPLKGSTFSYYSQNTFNINDAKTVKLVLNWYHQLPNKEDNTKSRDYKTVRAGIKLALLEKKLNINMSVSDIFKTARSKGTIYYTDNIQTFDNTWASRRFNVSASYTFGNSTNKKQIKEALFEEKNRSN